MNSYIISEPLHIVKFYPDFKHFIFFFFHETSDTFCKSYVVMIKLGSINFKIRNLFLYIAFCTGLADMLYFVYIVLSFLKVTS